MKRLVRHNILLITGVVLGALAGYLYWKFIGCSSGTCIITSNPINSTIYGGFMGGLLFSIIKSKKQEFV